MNRDTFDPHPFTGDEPATSDPAAGRPATAGQPAEDLAPEPEPGTDRPVYPPDADQSVDRPAVPATSEEPDVAATGADIGATRDDVTPVREGIATGREGITATSGGPSGVADFGPLFAEVNASEFQQRWSDIQSGFVEDPEGAVRLASDLTENIVTSLTSALEDRMRVLGDSARSGDTEQLRLVLRQYREVLEGVTSL
jgi:hypothetical protein